jgi:hypothetical protein
MLESGQIGTHGISVRWFDGSGFGEEQFLVDDDGRECAFGRSEDDLSAGQR